MARFQPNLKDAHAGFPMLPRGEYEFEITNVHPFFRVKDDGGESAGCTISLKVVGQVAADGSLETDKAEFPSADEQVNPNRVYIHTPKAFGMTKQFIMAAMGYPVRDEKVANEEYFDDADFSIDVNDDDPDNIEVIAGGSWDDLVGKTLRMTADVRMWQGNEQQDYRSFSPIK
jgi:hypothetical protein